MIPGVCQKGRSTYRRFKIKKNGKWRDLYIKLPDPSDPRFAEELQRLNSKVERPRELQGTIGALIAEYRPVLAKRDMAASTRTQWHYYLGLIQQEHGHRLVADIRRSHCYKIRDKMADEPGKANNYMAKLKALLEFAAERDWIAVNPASKLPTLATGEHEPWPAHVLREALGAASPMLRLAIISGLCSGQRVSDVIKMQHNWHDGRFMRLRSKKTDTSAMVPMHPLWLAEIAKVKKRAVTLLYDRTGKPFTGTDRIQERIRRLMHDLGHVDDDDQLLYTFHGLSKNAICYLTELGLDENTIEAIVGKTPETIRHYAKEARRWMLAEAAAETVIAGRIDRLVGKSAANVGRRASGD